jgi:alpha-beta hydrolase superfamily lysophospholipase
LADPSCRTETFTASDGYRWQYRYYPAKSTAQATIVCLHGIQSHGGWYEHSCGRLAEAGFDVYFLDRRGSGLNQQDRGDAPSFRRLIDDVAEFLQSLAGAGNAPVRDRRLNVFVVGISWGGKLAVALQRRHPGLVDGLVLLCPGFQAKVRPLLLQRLAIVWSRLISPRRLFPIPLDDPELFTATPRWLQFLRDDPLSLHQATARLLIESVRLDGYLRLVPRSVHMPILVMLAEHDRIIDNNGARRFVARFASTDQEIIEYRGAHHTLEFEPDAEIHIHDLIGWLSKRSAH